MEVYIDAREVEDLAAEILHHTSTVPGLTRAAVRKVGYDMQVAAQRYCPVDTGFLRASISSDFTGLAVTVGPTAEYGGYVELGVPHPFEITAHAGGVLHFIDDGVDVFTRRVTHPPMPPRPYLSPAFEENVPRLEEALGVIGGMAIAA